MIRAIPGQGLRASVGQAIPTKRFAFCCLVWEYDVTCMGCAGSAEYRTKEHSQAFLGELQS